MKLFLRLVAIAWATVVPSLVRGDVTVRFQQTGESSFFQFDSLPLPAVDDAAAGATWQVVRGRADGNSGPLSVLHDGRIPASEDSPRENFFFAAGTAGGCFAVDLGRAVDVSQVVTYSWHPAARAPQVFTLYAAADSAPDFTWNDLPRGQSPERAGWRRIAHVDTRTAGRPGGQHAALVTDTTGSIGSYRYLLFEVDQTSADDPFANTFFSEIDVIENQAGQPKRIVVPETKTLAFATQDETYRFVIDLTAAPELAAWSDDVLRPIIQTWYPKIVTMLPSDGFVAPREVRFRYLPGEKMEGVPAYAQGATISLNASWFRREKNREAAGAVVHEMVHVVQSYRSQRQRRQATPGWIIEGIPDYIRWFLYEPESRGAVLSPQALAKANHDASYRVSANFIDWVIRNHDPGGTLLRDLNADARQGRYSSDTWLRLTGKTESELADAWRSAGAAQPQQAKAAP